MVVYGVVCRGVEEVEKTDSRIITQDENQMQESIDPLSVGDGVKKLSTTPRKKRDCCSQCSRIGCKGCITGRGECTCTGCSFGGSK